jgi:hypothetical protein
MCSTMTEDLICGELSALGIDIIGPRGVDSSRADAGDSGNTAGWGVYYNLANDASLSCWGCYDSSDYSASVSYAQAYIFGAYLGRNFGGARFFHNVLHNSYTDSSAITYALSLTGNDDNISTILIQWGTAVLLSNKIDTGPGYQLNSGDWFEASYNGTLYSLGSINLYNYRRAYSPATGPVIHDINGTGYCKDLDSAANRFIKAGDSLTGVHTWNMRLYKNIKLTVVVRD